MLSMGTVQWIFIHTAADAGDCGAAEIDARHRARGWSGIGYHFVVRRSGTVEPGRDLAFAGAHVEGCNTRSVGICCEGHGDTEPHTPDQRASLLDLCRTLLERFDLSSDRVLGHRNVNRLIELDLVGDHYHTTTSCPGRLIDMDEIRAALGAPADFAPAGSEVSGSMGLFGWLLHRKTPTLS